MKLLNEGGFTLLELLLSMAVTAIIVVMVFGIFRVGIRAWERGERDIEKKQQLRTVTELVKKQLRSITISVEPKIKKGDRLIDFEGAAQRISFVSAIALDPKNRDHLVFSQYIVESSENGDSLYLWELPLVAMREPIDLLASEPDERYEMLSGMQSITFDYLGQKGSEEGRLWETEWEPTAEALLPVAVRILIVDPYLDAPIQMVIPLHGPEFIDTGRTSSETKAAK